MKVDGDNPHIPFEIHAEAKSEPVFRSRRPQTRGNACNPSTAKQLGRAMTGSASSSRPLPDHLFKAVVDSATDYAIISIDERGCVTSWNRGASNILGWKAEEILGRPADVIFTPQDRAAGVLRREMEAALSSGRASDDGWRCRKDGSRFWARGELTPLRQSAGGVDGFVKILRDRTEQRVAAENERAYSELLSGVMAASNDCIKVLDLDGRLLFMNEGGKSLMEVRDFEAVRGCHWLDFLEHGREQAAEALERARGGEATRFRTVARTMGGVPKWWDVQVSAIPGADGRPEKLLSVSRDITDLKAAEEHQKILMGEMAHRVKNTLAVAQAIASQSLRGDLNLVEARELLTGRLIALAQAHDVLLSGSWTEPSLAALVRQGVRAHGSQRFNVDGADVTISSRLGLALALVLHEFATNAAKYGALSNDVGRVTLRWKTEARGNGVVLRLFWQESGGPTVSPDPKLGFGSRLIERTLAGLGAKLTVEYKPEGLRAEIEVDLAVC